MASYSDYVILIRQSPVPAGQVNFYLDRLKDNHDGTFTYTNSVNLGTDGNWYCGFDGTNIYGIFTTRLNKYDTTLSLVTGWQTGGRKIITALGKRCLAVDFITGSVVVFTTTAARTILLDSDGNQIWNVADPYSQDKKITRFAQNGNILSASGLNAGESGVLLMSAATGATICTFAD
ncbi:MAG TPA: hypothetical protein VIJ25_10780, partial [Methylococcales bacterium]